VERLAGEGKRVGLPEERLGVGEDLPAVSLDEVVGFVVDGAGDLFRPPPPAGAVGLDPLPAWALPRAGVAAPATPPPLPR
jgi:hypothetical protein